MKPRFTIAQRFKKHVLKTSTCWLWQGKSHNGNGYFMTTLPGTYKKVYVHRLAYEHFKSSIPAGLTIDHLCKVKHCVNPEHLEVVTAKENALRGNSIPSINARKTHCKDGHLLANDNLYITPKYGRRQCKICIYRRGLKRRKLACKEVQNAL